MPRTIELTVKIKIKKIPRSEACDYGFEIDEISEFDLDEVPQKGLAECLEDNLVQELQLDQDFMSFAIDGYPYLVSEIEVEANE